MIEWISVNDRLPSRDGLMDDESEYVLVAEQYIAYDTGEKLGIYVSICGFEKDGWSDHDSFGNVTPEHITHWMPLPEPPKED